MLDAHQPHILVLSETKTTPAMHTNNTKLAIKRALSGYTIFMSSRKPTRGRGKKEHPQSGVLVGLKEGYDGRTLRHLIPGTLKGHLVHLSIHPERGNTTHLMGVYVPPDQPDTRLALNNYLKRWAAECKEQNTRMMVLGDWNAALYPEDRSRLTATSPADTSHAEMCRETGLSPLTTHSQPCERAHTYHRSSPPASSRIDDCLFLGKGSSDLELRSKATEEVAEAGDSLDHRALITTFHHSLLSLQPKRTAPTAQGKRAPKLKLPLKPDQISAAMQRINEVQMGGIQDLRHRAMDAHSQLCGLLTPNFSSRNIRTTVTGDTAHAARTELNAIANSLWSHLAQAQKTVEDMCECTQPPPPRPFFNRSNSRRYSQLLRESKRLKGQLQKHHEEREEAGLPTETPPRGPGAQGHSSCHEAHA